MIVFKDAKRQKKENKAEQTKGGGIYGRRSLQPPQGASNFLSESAPLWKVVVRVRQKFNWLGG